MGREFKHAVVQNINYSDSIIIRDSHEDRLHTLNNELCTCAEF